MAGNFDTSGTQSSGTKITLSPGLKADAVWMLFILKGTVKSFVNDIPLHNKSQTNLFGSSKAKSALQGGWFFSPSFHFPASLFKHIRSETAWWSQCSVFLTSPLLQDSPQYSSRLSALRFGADSHCDGQLEILFILIQLSFPISQLD